MRPVLAESLTDDQLQSLLSGFGKLTFIAAVLIAALLMLLAVVVARRVARRVRDNIEAELNLRDATDTDSAWSAAGRRVEMDPAQDESDLDDEDDDEDEDEDWRPDNDPDKPW